MSIKTMKKLSELPAAIDYKTFCALRGKHITDFRYDPKKRKLSICCIYCRVIKDSIDFVPAFIYTAPMRGTKTISKRQPIPIRLDEGERTRLGRIASYWGTSLAGAIRRLIRETKIKKEEFYGESEERK